MAEKIWKHDVGVATFEKRSAGTAITHLGIEAVEVGPDFLRARMPVDERTRQPIGILHGGASVLLAETLMSTAGNWVINFPEEYCVGQEINANHIRSARDGYVEAEARPLHIGKSSQVWETKITQNGKLICVSRMTLANLRAKREKK